MGQMRLCQVQGHLTMELSSESGTGAQCLHCLGDARVGSHARPCVDADSANSCDRKWKLQRRKLRRKS